ncbi:hypothetical protein [Bdellovibrio sp. BCCA]|uniref:hypothetical protein n=1 Tax=Bdellovibrio sp. BCCA TaxID=3136281 RepID=UPI0030F17555
MLKKSNVIAESVTETKDGVTKAMTIWAYLDQLPRVEEKISDLNKLIKKNKLELDPIVIEAISPVYMKRHTFVVDGVNKDREFRAVDIVIKGTMPAIPDYEMVAMITRPEDKISQGLYVTHVDGKYSYDPKWESHDFKCDHCGTKRRRDEIFILYHKPNSKLISVGKSCLEEFLPKKTLKSILQFCSDFDVLKSSFSMDLEFDYVPQLVQTAEALAAAISFIEQHGYISQKSAEISLAGISTVNMVRHALFEAPDANQPAINIEPRHRNIAHKAHSQVSKYLEKVSDPSYANNIRVAVGSEYIGGSKIGYLCAFALEVCKAEMIKIEFQLKNASGETKPSEFQGSKGERIVRRVTILDRRTFGGYNRWTADGMTTVYVMADADGNQYVAFPSNFDHEIGYEFIFKATVKDHQVDKVKGTKQTIINRIVIENDAEIDKAVKQLDGLKLSSVSLREEGNRNNGYTGLIDDLLHGTNWATASMFWYKIVLSVEKFRKEGKEINEELKQDLDIVFSGRKLTLSVTTKLETSQDLQSMNISQVVKVRGADNLPKW